MYCQSTNWVAITCGLHRKSVVDASPNQQPRQFDMRCWPYVTSCVTHIGVYVPVQCTVTVPIYGYCFLYFGVLDSDTDELQNLGFGGSTVSAKVM
jgi:hypothetical protein